MLLRPSPLISACNKSLIKVVTPAVVGLSDSAVRARGQNPKKRAWCGHPTQSVCSSLAVKRRIQYPPENELLASCRLPRLPRRGLCSYPKANRRRWMSRPSLKYLVRCSAVFRCLLQSCDGHAGCLGPGCSLGSVLSYHQYPTRLPHFHYRCRPRGDCGGRHFHHDLRLSRSDGRQPPGFHFRVCGPQFAAVIAPLVECAPFPQRFR